MQRRTAVLLCAILVSLPLAADDMSEALDQMQKSKEEAAKAADFILANADRAPAANLFIASAVMLGRERTEDAAFLYYAAQMRRRLDVVRFPPTGSGGDSPDVLLGALSQQIGAAVNPAILRQPKQLSAALDRIAAWAPATPKSYEPGWKYSKRTADAAAQSAFEENRKDFLDHFRPIAMLLNRPDYFAAFKTLQDYNFSSFEEMRKPARIKEKEAAEKKMTAIEKELNVEGLYYRRAPR